MTMGMWFILGLVLVVTITILSFVFRSSAKKKAKRIISTGKISNWREFKSVCDMLSIHGNDDLESADLWKKLQELKETTPNPTSPS